MSSNLANARNRLKAAAEHVDCPDEVVERLEYPMETLSASIPVRMDDGSLKFFKGWRARHSDLLGTTGWNSASSTPAARCRAVWTIPAACAAPPMSWHWSGWRRRHWTGAPVAGSAGAEARFRC